MSTEHKDDGLESDGSHQETNESKEVPFLRRPVALLEYAVQQAEKYNHEYDERGRYAHPIKRLWFRLLCYRVTWIICIGAGSVAFCWYLVSIRFLDTNQTQAFFAGILTIATIATWWAMYVQNDIMVKQMRQTDRMIDHMRDEQRAWLTVINARIGDIKQGEPIKCSLQILNTGPTPGKIILGTIFVTVRPTGFPDKKLIEEFEAMGFKSYDEFIAPPGKEINIVVTELSALPNEEFDTLQERTSKLHVLCRFRYLDAILRPHHIKAHHTLDLDDRGLYLRNNYGSMD
jgi:hypothetical protein